MKSMNIFETPSPITLFKNFDKVNKGNLLDDYLVDKDRESFIKTVLYEWAPIWMTSNSYDFKSVFELVQGLYLLKNDKELYKELNGDYITMIRFTCKAEYDYLMEKGVINKNFRNKENDRFMCYKYFCDFAGLNNLLFGWWESSNLDGKYKEKVDLAFKVTYKIPRSKCYIMKYYNWSDLLFNFVDAKNLEQAENICKKEFKGSTLANLLAETPLVERDDYIQICVQDLKMDWVQAVEEVNYTII